MDALSVILFFNQDETTALKRELSSYLGKIAAMTIFRCGLLKVLEKFGMLNKNSLEADKKGAAK